MGGNPLDSFAGLINVINAENVTITGEGTIDANAQNGDWYQNPKKNNIAWRPRLFFTSGAKNVVLHGVLVCNSYSWTIHPTYSENVDILNIRIRNSSHEPQHRRHSTPRAARMSTSSATMCTSVTTASR